MAKAPIPGQDLFAPLPELTNDLFAQPKVAPLDTGGGARLSIAERAIYNATKPKQPTKKELEEADRNNQIAAVQQQLDQMRQSPDWQNASLDRRKQMFKDWQTSKWFPFVESIEDKKLKKSLDMLPYNTLQPDITNLQKTIQDSSRLADTGHGIARAASQTASGLADIAPAAIDQARVTNLRNMLAQDGQPLVLGGVPQLKSDGSPVIQQFTPEQRKQVEDEIAELTKNIDAQLKEAGESKQYQDAQTAQQSVGQIDRDRELQEDIEKSGGFMGTVRNAAANPSNVLQLAAEQLPNAVPAVAASVAGGIAGGAPGAIAAGRAAGTVLSAQDAMSSAQQQTEDFLKNMSEEDLLKLEPYKRLRDQGVEPEQAKRELALNAAFQAGGLGALVGYATGGLGAETGAGTLAGNIARGTTAPAGQSVARTLGSAALTAGRELGVEGAEEGGTQYAANVAQNQQSGANIDTMTGVGQATAQGILASGPLTGATTTINVVRDLRAQPTATPPGAAPGETAPAPEAAPAAPEAAPAAPTGGTDEVTAVPTAAEAAAAEAAAAPAPETVPQATAEAAPAPGTGPTTLADLRPVFMDIRSRNGTAYDATEANAFIDTLLDAEANGVDNLRIQLALEQISPERAVPPGLGYTSIMDGYQQRRAARLNADASEVAADLTNVGDQNGGPLAEGDTGNAPTSDSINSAIEAAAEESQQARSEVSEAAERVAGVTEDAGLSRTTGDDTTADAGNARADETLGAVADTSAADSGLNNQQLPGTSPAVSVSERSELGTPGQRAADGGSTDSSAVSEARSDARIGQEITFREPTMGMTMTGRITGVNPDGSFSTENLASVPAENIIETDARGQTPVQAEATREDNAESLARLEQAVADNRISRRQADRLVRSATRRADQANDRSLAGDLIDEYLGKLESGAVESRPRDNPNITPMGRDMIGLRSTAMSAMASNDPAVLQAASDLVNALTTNDQVAADNAASILQQHNILNAEPIYTAEPARQDNQDVIGPDTSALDNSQAEMTEGQMTPSGYSVDELNRKADRLSESDSEHQSSGIDMLAALEQGDYAKADQIAQYLYESGLRQFMPPQESTGRARTTINDAFMNELTPVERLASQREFAEMRDAEQLPPEASTYQSFRDVLTQDAMQEAAGQPALSDLWNRVSEGTRNIMRKLAKALAIVLAAISINQMTPINDAMAAQTGSTVQTVQQVQGLSRAASTVNSWIQEHKDNKGQSYIIADKQSGEIHIIGPDGKVKATAPALYGRKNGDGMSLGETPAGVFTIKQEAAPASYGGDLQQFASAPNGDIYAIHRVLTTNPKQNRLGRLASATAADNRVSLGCINIPVDIYNKYLSGSFKGKLYVLPDQRSLGEMFQGINDTAAKQDLTVGQQAPQDLAAPTNAQFESSTPAMAQKDMAPAKPTANPVNAKPAMEYGAAITEAAAQADEATATSELAAQSNGPADQALWGAAIFPFFAFRRNQRRASKGRPGALPDESLPPNEPERTIADKDYHKVTGALDDQTVNVSDRQRIRSGALGDLMRKAAYKLSDTHVYFINWMNDTGLTRGYAEFDDHPAIQYLKSMTNRTRNRTKALYDQHLAPVYDFVASVHDRTGRDIDMVAQELGSIKTFYHIIEANRELRKGLQQNLDDVYLTGTEEQVAQAEAALRAFDQAQAGQITVQQLRDQMGTGGLAGGLTDAQARAGIAKLSAKYRPEDVAQFRELTRRAVQGMVDARLRGDPANGIAPNLTAEDVAAWDAHGFQDYVPLYVNHEQEDGANDIYLGTSNFNPVGDYTRKGSVTTASHSMVTLQQFLYRTAAGLESQPFKDQIHAIYTSAKDKNALGGLQRVNLNDARMNPQSEFFNADVYAAKGLNYAVRGVDEDGNQTITRYKYYWNDDKIADGLFRRNGEPDWKTAIPTTITGTFGKFMTKYNPLFPWKTMWRDAGERTRTIAAKQVRDQDGNIIPATRLYGHLTAATHNPMHPLNLGLYFASGGRLAADTATVKAYKELQALGGVSTYQDALAKSITNMRSQIRSMRGVRKYAKQLDSFFTHYNEALAAAPAVGGYLALQNLGVDNRTAAARSLDVMNASNKGEWTQTLSMFYPFISPTFEGGRNLLRNLSTTRGRVIFAANTMTSVALYGMLYSLAAGYGDDDDNPLDKISLDDLANYIPLVMGENNIIKIPVAFGQSRISWTLGAGLARMAQGVDNPGKVTGSVTAALLRELQPLEYESKIAADNIIAGLALTAMPSIAKPMAEVAFNTNHFGSPIHSPKPDAGFASDAARASTPEVWTDIARTVEKITGFDAFPESYRHLASGYMVGPMRGIMTALESGSQYQAGGNLTARQELGPVWDAVGVGQFWDNGSRGVSTQYYQYQDKADDVFRKYHVPKSAPGTAKGESGIDARDRVIKAGGTIQEAMLVQYAKEAESERAASNRALKQQVKGMKAKDIDLEVLTPQYQQHQMEQERMMRRFIRQARGLQE